MMDDCRARFDENVTSRPDPLRQDYNWMYGPCHEQV